MLMKTTFRNQKMLLVEQFKPDHQTFILLHDMCILYIDYLYQVLPRVICCIENKKLESGTISFDMDSFFGTAIFLHCRF